MNEADPLTLRLFLSVCELRNLTRAAERHHIAPSAVTKRIGDLERMFGVTLFDRLPHGMAPTHAGEELARHAREALLRLDRLGGVMQDFAGGARGAVRVRASASVLLEALVAAIADFHRAHPRIRVDLVEAMSWGIVRDLTEGRADVGVVVGSVEIGPELDSMLFRRDRLMALLPARHDLAGRAQIGFAELLDETHVGLGVGSAISLQLADEASRIGGTMRYAVRAATYDVARLLVSHGFGIAVLPRSLVAPHADRLGLVCVPLADAFAHREMRACWRRDPAPLAAARMLIEHLRPAPPA